MFFVADSTFIRVLMCFSLQHNFNELVSMDQKPSDIQALHGIRALSALALIISHKVMALFYNPYINRTKMVEVRFEISLGNIQYIQVLSKTSNSSINNHIINKGSIEFRIYTIYFLVIYLIDIKKRVSKYYCLVPKHNFRMLN